MSHLIKIYVSILIFMVAIMFRYRQQSQKQKMTDSCEEQSKIKDNIF